MIRVEVLEHVAPPLIKLWPLILKCATATCAFLKIAYDMEPSNMRISDILY